MRTCVLLHVSSVQPRLGKGCCRRHFWLFQEIPHFTSTGKIHSHSHLQWRIQARGPGGRAPPYVKTKLRPEGPKKCFWRPPPSFSKGLDARAPSPLISGSESGTDLGLEQAHKNSRARRWPFLFMKDFLFFLFLYFFLKKIIDKIRVKVRSILKDFMMTLLQY